MAIQILQQQKLLPVDFQQQIRGTAAPPSSSSSSSYAPKINNAPLIIQEFQPKAKKTLEENFFSVSDPDENIRPLELRDNEKAIQKISSIDDEDHVLEIHASPRQAKRSPVMIEGQGQQQQQQQQQPKNSPKAVVGGGLVWNIDTNDNRPKSRIKSFQSNKPAAHQAPPSTIKPILDSHQPHSPNEKMNLSPGELVERNSPKKIARPASWKEGAGGFSSPPQALEVFDEHQKPRSQSANRHQRPQSRPGAGIRPAKAISNFNQVKNAVNYVCLAGVHLEDKRNELIELLEFYHTGREIASPITPECLIHEV